MNDQTSEPVGEVRITGVSEAGRWLRTVILTADLPNGTKVYAAPPAPEWRCFHCGAVFKTHQDAIEHFGTTELDVPACRLAEDAAGLIKIIRDQEAELRVFRSEDTPTAREFYALGAAHARALCEEEEKGYARGLADGRAITSAVPDGWRDEAQSIAQAASAALNQSAGDQRNILEDVAERLCVLLAAAPETQA